MSTIFPGTEGILHQEVLDRLDEVGKKGVAAEQLRERLEADVQAEDLERTLTRLQASGRAVEWEGRWFSVAKTDWVVGRISVLDSGDAMVKSGLPGEDGLFIRKRNLKRALDGDLVVARWLGRRREADWKLPEGTVVKILSDPEATLVGTLEVDDRERRWMVPFDPKVSVDLEVMGADDVPDGHYVVVSVERTTRGRKAWGRLIEVLGDLETPGVDVLVILRHYRIPEEFPPEVLAAAAGFPPDPTPADWAGREDLRGRVVVTIDGEKARDFDDAVSIERLPKGMFRLGVHIADVAHYVEEGSALDLEAYRRGTSVYYPERAVPMLPEALSNGLCSLRPHVPRLTVSVFLDIDKNGQVQNRRYAETVIRSSRRLTYTEVRRVLEEPRAEDAADYGEVLPALRDMLELMQTLNRERMARGSIDFDLPEGNVELDPEGVMVGVRAGERNVAHRLVEEFMLAANEAVAFELVSHEVPALFRVHDAPDPQRLEELRQLLAELGFRLEGELVDLHPSILQKLLQEVQGHAEEPFISSVVLRSMQRAVYSPECRGHYALAARYYAHFTSPIRRYPDLVVHRGLKSLLHDAVQGEVERTRIPERLEAMGEHTSMTERRAEQSERDLLQWKKVRFLADRIGERFHGRVTGVQPFGLFIQLQEYYVDGLVPVRSMTDDYYVYEAEGHRLVGERNGRTFKLGDPLEVELVNVSLRHRGLDFELVDMTKAEPRQEAPWRRAMDHDPPHRRESGARRERREHPRGTPPPRETPEKGGARKPAVRKSGARKPTRRR